MGKQLNSKLAEILMNLRFGFSHLSMFVTVCALAIAFVWQNVRARNVIDQLNEQIDTYRNVEQKRYDRRHNLRLLKERLVVVEPELGRDHPTVIAIKDQIAIWENTLINIPSTPTIKKAWH